MICYAWPNEGWLYRFFFFSPVKDRFGDIPPPYYTPGDYVPAPATYYAPPAWTMEPGWQQTFGTSYGFRPPRMFMSLFPGEFFTFEECKPVVT